MNRTILVFARHLLSLEGLLSLPSDYHAGKSSCDTFLTMQCSLHGSGLMEKSA